jgi:hypothetical protein
VLAEHGFEQVNDHGIPGWPIDMHAEAWSRERDRVKVDLHVRIPGIGCDARTAWERLSSTTERVRVGYTEVPALGVTARTLHLALHAAQHGVESDHTRNDLTRGLRRLPEESWRAAAALADELDASEPMAVALRLVPEGRELADRLGLPSDVSTRWALWAETRRPWSKRLYMIATVPGARAKARWLAAGLVPPAPYMRLVFPWARAGRSALILAYVVRAIAGLRHLPHAVWALWRARAHARRSR